MELLIQKEIKMTTTNEKLRNVAEIAARIMMGEKALHPNQQKLDVHEPEKDKLTAKDFEMLRAGKKKVKENLEDFSLEEIEAFMMSEDFEQLDELSKQTLKSYRVKSIGRDIDFEKKGYELANKDGGAGSDRADQMFNKSDLVTAARKRAQEKMRKEEVEELDELSKDTLKSYRVKSIGRDARIEKKGYEAANKDGGAGSDRADQLFNKADLVTAARKRAQEKMRKEDVELTQEEFDQLDEVSKKLLRSYLKGSKKENDPRIHGDSAGAHSQMSNKARSLGRTEQDKEDSRYEGSKLAKRKLGIPGTIPAKVMAKEEVEQIDEEDAYEKDRYAVKNGKAVKDNPTHQGSPNYKDQPHHVYATSAENALKKHTKKEEVDQAAEFVLEYESKDGKFVHRAKPGVYGGTKDEKHAVDTLKGPKMKELSDIEAEKKKKKKMSEMVALYQEQGLKGLFASLVKEEPDNEQFTKELEAQKAKNAGEGKKAEVAKAAVQAVQEEEFEVVMNEPNGYAEATIEERSMTEPEIKKKEQIVKSMKKGISGFKARYGDDAKNVMYATATKRAMGEEVEQIEEGTPEGYQRRDGKLIPKIHPTMTPHEHGYDYTMQSIEDAPSKAKIHSQHKEIVKDNPHPQGSKEHKDWEAGTNKAKADHLKDWS